MLLPEKAQYTYLASLPEGDDLAEAINTAMKYNLASKTEVCVVISSE